MKIKILSNKNQSNNSITVLITFDKKIFKQAYVGSYQVEDSCQFLICGQEFNHEFGVGASPAAESCSGDCHDLASSLITNRFTKDFLWSKCASMCSDKYNFSTFR